MGQNPHDRSVEMFEDPNDNDANNSKKVVKKNLVTKHGLHDGTAGGTDPGGPTWKKVKNFKRTDLMALSNFREPGTPVNAKVAALTAAEVYKIGKCLAEHNGMDYPDGVFSCCTCG